MKPSINPFYQTLRPHLRDVTISKETTLEIIRKGFNLFEKLGSRWKWHQRFLVHGEPAHDVGLTFEASLQKSLEEIRFSASSECKKYLTLKRYRCTQTHRRRDTAHCSEARQYLAELNHRSAKHCSNDKNEGKRYLACFESASWFALYTQRVVLRTTVGLSVYSVFKCFNDPDV